MVVYAAVEGGGTAWKVALVDEDLTMILEEAEFDTTTPEETLGKIKCWLEERSYNSLGVASFGPVDARPDSAHYGFITTTPKPGWKDTDVLELLGARDQTNIPFLFDTDVNAPALAEYMNYKESMNISSFAYITVGTGVGVGIVANGQTIKGLVHPEGGHIPVIRHPDDDFENSCPYHHHCLEGYCNNISIAQRLGIDKKEVKDIPDDHPVWNYLAFYIAQLCTNLVLIVSVEKISVGGGIMQRPLLVDLIRKETRNLLSGYIAHPSVNSEAGMQSFITQSTWEQKAGLMGAAYLAKMALAQS